MRLCGRLAADGRTVTVEVVGGRIAAVRPGAEDGVPGDAACWLSPAFHDLQVNGYAGQDCARACDWDLLLSRLARSGTALFCPTIVTASREAMLGSLEGIGRAIDSSPSLARAVTGIHVEGPYIAAEDGPRGAHPREHVRPPDLEEFARMQGASGGRVRIVTLAPETAGALAFIEAVAAQGVVVAIGHTAASPEQVRDAVHAGATLSTHLGNGCHAMLPRHPNYVWTQLAEDRLTAGIIADGRHLPGDVLRCVARVKGAGRLVTVSDAVDLGGMPAGRYEDGRVEVDEAGNVLLAGTAFLAGAGFLLDTGLANLLRHTDLGLAGALASMTGSPARVLGLADRKGRVAAGYDADLTLFRLEEGTVRIDTVVRGGETVVGPTAER